MTIPKNSRERLGSWRTPLYPWDSGWDEGRRRALPLMNAEVFHPSSRREQAFCAHCPFLASTTRQRMLSPSAEDNGVATPRLTNRVNSLPTSVGQKTCNLDCICVCHRRNRLKSPDILSPVLGSLFVGYKGSLWSLQECDQPYCRSHATRITYTFPPWLSTRAISVSMVHSHSENPVLSLRVVRVRPGDANIFTAVFRGTRQHVQRLLEHTEASICDVDLAHNTPLLVSSDQS